jgi:hypothetical protein
MMVLLATTIIAAQQPPALGPREMESLIQQSISCRKWIIQPNKISIINLSVSFLQHDRILSQSSIRCPGLKVEFYERNLNRLLSMAETIFTDKGIIVHLKMDVVGKMYWSNETQSPAIKVSKIIQSVPWFFETIQIGVGNR